ncbi:hypothetical protein ccbrp13_11140 [Ktedonobacteria bacterium brp13]|nr:hypothetical protein ccbrp13_11140 [Ktedonobacteria bacterium brp13]
MSFRSVAFTLVVLFWGLALCLIFPASASAHAGILDANPTGTLDTSTLFGFLAIALADVGVAFWVGAQLWRVFVLQLIKEEHTEQRTILRHMEQRFDRSFSVPLLLLIFVANIGVLVGHGQFGLLWLIQQAIVLLALVAVVVTTRLAKGSEQTSSEGAAWICFILGLGLLCVMALSGAGANAQPFSVLADLLYLLAVSLWIGGTFYLSLIYLPVLDGYTTSVQTHSLLSILQHYSTLAFTGIGLLVVSGLLNATVHNDSWDQLIATVYGRTLLITIVLFFLLLLVSVSTIFILRPRLAKRYAQYQMASESPADGVEVHEKSKTSTASQTNVLEQHVGQHSKQLSTILRWEPVVGVMILLCTGLLSVFSGTLQSAVVPTAPASQQPAAASNPYIAHLQTKDKLYNITLKIDPNQFGINTFTATVYDSHGKNVPTAGISASLYLTMLDMDMGTQEVTLRPDKTGSFSTQDELSMEGHWELKLNVQTADAKLHSVTVDFKTPTS